MISVCAIRSKTRVIFGTRFGTRVPNSTNYVPNGSYILLKYKNLPNSDLSYWKIYVILHRKIINKTDIVTQSKLGVTNNK